MTPSFHLKKRPIRLLARNLCLIPQPCLRLRSTATDLFPGSGFPVFAGVDGPKPLPDSSFTEGVYCVSGRIPALSVSDSLHRAHGLAFSPLPMPSLTPAGRFREVSLPSGPRQARPGCLTTLYTGLRKLLDQKRMCFVLTATFSSGEAPPHSPFFFSLRCRHARIHH